jgi:SPOR domain
MYLRWPVYRFRDAASVIYEKYDQRQSGTSRKGLSKLQRSERKLKQTMRERHHIELAFSRRRFAAIIGTAVITGFGLLAAGLYAGIEVGSVQARSAIPLAVPETPMPLSLPLQFAHELPVIPPVESAPETEEAYVVQAASFRGRGQAATLAADLTQRGYSAGIADFQDQAGRSWWIVRVGPYAAREEASQAASELGPFTRSEPIVRVADN